MLIAPVFETQLSMLFSVMQILEGLLKTSLPPEIKDCPSLSILKSRLTSRVDHDNVPKYYYYGPRLTQILHARLRMRSSSLNEHLYIKNIIDSPNVFVEVLNLHIIIYSNIRNILIKEIVFFESYCSY